MTAWPKAAVKYPRADLDSRPTAEPHVEMDYREFIGQGVRTLLPASRCMLGVTAFAIHYHEVAVPSLLIYVDKTCARSRYIWQSFRRANSDDAMTQRSWEI